MQTSVLSRINKWTAVGLIYNPVPHHLLIIEVARNVLDDLDVIIATVRALMVERFDRNTILVFEKSIQ